jgi:hypothetical protein
MGRSRGRARRRIDKAFSPGASRGFAGANMTAQPRTYGLAEAINAATNGGWGIGQMRDMMRDPRDDVAFGPSNPLAPAPIDPLRPDTQRPEPRLTEYPVAWNLPGNSDRLTPWSTLRAAASSVDIMRRCISIRKEQLQGLEWAIGLDDAAVQGIVAAGDGSQGRTDVEADLRRSLLPEIKRLTEFWCNPWKANGLSFEQWVNGIMEDHLVLDAVAIYPRMTYGGDVSAFELIDATTIKLLIDYRGARPLPPYPAFQQVLYGFPRGEFSSAARLETDEDGNVVELVEPGIPADQLWYFREEYRSFTPYGYSAVEQSLISARLYLKRQGWMLAEYDDGSTPLTWLVPDSSDGSMAEKLTFRTRRQWEDSLNDELAGQTRARHRMKVAPPGMNPVQMAGVDERYKPDYDMHLIKMLAGHFGVTSSGLGFSESRGLGNSGLHEGQADVQDASTTKPDTKMIERIVNELSRTYLKMPEELRFKFVSKDVEDQAAEDVARNAQRARGTITLNDDRKAIGKTPFTFPEADMPMVLVGTGWVPLEGMAERAEQAAEAEQALVEDQLANSEAAREQTAVEGEEVAEEDAAKALELSAYRRWARKRGGDARRPFICKALSPSNFPGEQVPHDVDFAEWEWVPDTLPDDCETADIVKAFGGNDNWRTLARDSRGRWVKRGSMRVDALGPASPDKPVLAGLARDAERRRTAAAPSAVDVTRGSSAADKLRRAELMYGTDRSKWPAKARQDAAKLERQLPVSDASSTMDPMTSPTAPKLTAAQQKTLDAMRANPDRLWGRDTARQGNGFNVNSLDALERAGLVEFYDNPDPDAPSYKKRLVRVKGDAAPAAAPSAELGSLKLTSAQAMTEAGQRYGRAKLEHAEARALYSRVEGHATASVDRPKFRARLDAAETELRAAQDALSTPSAKTPEQHDVSVRDVVTSLQKHPGGWVAMADVRRKLAAEHGMDRGQQDAAIRRLATTGDRSLNVAPEDNQKTLTDADHAAAVDLGAGPQHIISLDPPRKSVLDTVRESSEQAAAASAVIDSVPGLREGVARQQPRTQRRFDDGPLTTSADDPELTTVREATPRRGYDIPASRDGRVAAALADIPEVRQTTRGRGKQAREAFSAAGFLHDTREAAEAARRAEAERLVDREDRAAELDRAAIEAEGRNDAEGAALARADRAQMRYEDAQSRTDHLGDLAETLDTDEARARHDAAVAESERLRAEADAAERAYNAAQRPRLRAEQDAANQRVRENLERINAERAERERKAAEDAAAEVERKAREREENARRVAEIQAETRAELARRTPEAFALMLDGGDKATTHAPSRKILAEMREQGWTMTHMNGSMMRFEAPDGRAVRMTYGKDRVKWERGDYKGNQTMGESISLPTAAALVADKPAPAARAEAIAASTPDAPANPDKAAYDKLLDEGLVKHKNARQIVEQMEAHGWRLTGQSPMMQTTDWEAPDGRKMAVQFLTSDKPKFYPSGRVGEGKTAYKDALAHVVTPTHAEVGGPNVRRAAEQVSPGLGQRISDSISRGSSDEHVRRLDRAQRELVGYGSTPKRPVADIVADLRGQADRTDATAQSNAEHHARMGHADLGESPVAVRQRREAAELRAIADVMDQQAAARAEYEAERERRAAAPLDIRPTARSAAKAKPTPARKAEAVAAATPDAPMTAAEKRELSQRLRALDAEVAQHEASNTVGLSKRQRDMAERFDKLAGEHAADPAVAQWRARALELTGEMEQVGSGALARRDADAIRDQMATVQDEFTHAMAGARAAAAARDAGGDERAQKIANTRATLDSRARKVEKDLALLERQVKDYTGETRKILRKRINDAKAKIQDYQRKIDNAERDHDTKLVYDESGKLVDMKYEPPTVPAAAPSINDMMAQQMAASTARPEALGERHGKVTGDQIQQGTRVQFRGTAWTVEEKPRRARPDAEGRTGVVFRATREDQGITSTMRLNDGSSIALAAPKGGTARPKADASAVTAGAKTRGAALAAAPRYVEADDARKVDRAGAAALERYRGKAFTDINRELRAGAPSAATARTAEQIDRVMVESRLTDPVVLHRGIGDVGRVFGEAAKRKLTGAEWVDSSFQSTTTDPDVADRFRINEGEGRNTTARIVTRVPAGVGAVQLSDERYEAELLLQRGLRMRVVSDTGPWRRGQKNPRTIEVEVILA